MPELLAPLQVEHAAAVEALMAATARMVEEIDPNGERDHRSHWDATLKAQRRKPDLFDQLRYSSDELAVIAIQVAGCDELPLFRVLIDREAVPLERLERYVPTVQLQRRWFPNLQAADLPIAVKRIRKQHDAAVAVIGCLSKLAA